MTDLSHFASETRRRVMESLAPVDNRPNCLKLRDAVRAHLANAERLNAVCAACELEIDKDAFARAEAALEASRADLYCLVEDLFCVSAEQLCRALQS